MEKNRKFPFVSNIYSSFLESEFALKRFLGRFLYKPEDIDDMAQETFLRAYSATQGRDIDSPKAYLFQVAKTMALKELSRKSKQPKSPVRLPPALQGPLNPSFKCYS